MSHGHSRLRTAPRALAGAPPRRPVLAFLMLVVLMAVALVPLPPAAAAAFPAKLSTPFAVRSEGYSCFRIPALVTDRSGALLAFAEGRVTDCSDVGHIDLVMKRSTDGGRTWGPLTVLAGADDEWAYGNPAPVVDARTGRISLLYATSDWTQNADGTRSRGARELRVLHSLDDGATWQQGAGLAHLKPAGWRWVSVGPGHGIQLTRGAHAGRLVVPGDHTTTQGQGGGQLYYSDDGGLTWALGAHSEADVGTARPGELSVLERTDGTLHVNARSSQTCETNAHRLAATSEDAGATFSSAFVPVTGLDAPPVFGSLLRLSATDEGAGRDRILLSAPARLGASVLEDRRELAIRSSYDEGRTWQTVGTLVVPGRAGYSDLTLLPTGTIGMVYETATTTPHGTVAFTAFTEPELDAAQTELRLPRTSDTSGNTNHAVVHGDAQLGTRGSGKALDFDGRDDYLRLVNCGPSLRLGASDFTVTAWFRYSAPTGPLPILWGYGMGAGERQFWLRAEPGSGFVRAAIDTGTEYAEVRTPSSYGDGAWHHVVFTRQHGQLRLSVDGGPDSTSSAPAGDITPSGPFSVYVGARPDFPDQPVGITQLFKGGLDDVRVFGRGLTADETAQVRGGALDVANNEERVRLAFSSLW
ncbi:sialidase family protein [Streptomyces sp. NPDC094034]|uniref:sialidase family protein n=1 Tax=Streptomyces sp. NPDC094034 TaxID=3155309 RepID=UPI00331DB202